MSKLDYLKKYLNEPKIKKKKILKKNQGKINNLKILDDDIGLNDVKIKGIDIDLIEVGDDRPIIVEDVENVPLGRFTNQNWSSDVKEEFKVKEEPLDEEADDGDERINQQNKQRKRHDSSDSDQSSLRKITNDDDNKEKENEIKIKIEKEIKKEKSPTPDMSPLRRSRVQDNNSDSDLNPQRKRYDSSSDSSPPRKLNKREDKNKIKKDKNLDKIEVIFRDKTGKKRDLEKEKIKKIEEENKREALEEKYKQWSKGIKQNEIIEKNKEELKSEINKPLARYADDADLDEHLKELEREGDPMLEYIRKKKAKKTGGGEKNEYKGREAPLNRFNIKPGYRWDGVDRSNGFEKSYFSKLNERKAIKEIAYKWSTEDM